MAQCPDCGVGMVDVTIGGSQLGRCEGCEGVFVRRQVLLDLRKADQQSHPALAESAAGGEAPAAIERGPRGCPGCGQPMQTYRYRGGATEAERCDACDALFLDRGELGQILGEWRQGIAMSAGAREALEGYREDRFFERFLAADGALGSLGLAAVGFFVWWFIGPSDRHHSSRHDWDWTWPAVAAAAAVAIGWYYWRRRELRAERREAKQGLREAWRAREAKARRGGAPKPYAGDVAEPSAGSAGSGVKVACPWCSEQIPESATHCPSCDSDVF